MRRVLIVCILAASSVAFTAGRCVACSCAGMGTAKEQRKAYVRGADVIFTGIATKVEVEQATGPIIGGEMIRTHFRVETSYKGKVGFRTVVVNGQVGNSCTFGFEVGDRYSVFASRDRQGTLFVGGCSGTRRGKLNASAFRLSPKRTMLGGPASPTWLGHAVAGIPDLSGDGHDDLLLGAPRFSRPRAYDEPAGSGRRAGAVFVSRTKTEFTKTDLKRLRFHSRRIDGASAGDLAGWSVAGAGDVNGDGFPDLLVGAPGAGRDGADLGAAYVVFGSELSELPTSFAGLGAQGFAIWGPETGSRAGSSVAAAGDVNGDGLDDVLVGAPSATPGGVASGAAYLVLGSAAHEDVDLVDPQDERVFRVRGAAPGDELGASVAGAGDHDDDGVADLVIGAPGTDSGAGAAHVISGAELLAAGDLDLGHAEATPPAITGDAGDALGASVAGAGDSNGDGMDDVVVGAPAPEEGRPGDAYVLFGSPLEPDEDPGAIGADDVGSEGFRIRGGLDDDLFGAAVAPMGDVDGDGLADVAVGAPQRGGEETPRQRVYVIGGRTGGETSAKEALMRRGINRADHGFGASIGSLSDLNGDSAAELVVGAFRAPFQKRRGAGRVYVLPSGVRS